MENNALNVGEKVLDWTGKSSSDITHSLRNLGDGQMEKGGPAIFALGVKYGAEAIGNIKLNQGRLEGVVAASAVGVILLAIHQSVKKIQTEYKNSKLKIDEVLDAMKAAEEENTADSQNATESVSDESDALSEQDETTPPKESA